MQVELKNVKHFPSGSQETECFTATIYIDGKRAGTVQNNGHGGCDILHFDDPNVSKAFHAYAKSLPPLPPNPEVGMTEPLPYDAELLIGDLLGKHLLRKQLQRYCKKETLIRLKGDKKGEFRRIPNVFTPAIKAALVKKYGDTIIEIANETIA